MSNEIERLNETIQHLQGLIVRKDNEITLERNGKETQLKRTVSLANMIIDVRDEIDKEKVKNKKLREINKRLKDMVEKHIK